MINANDCPEIVILSSFSDGELSNEEVATVKVHLANCSACAGRLKAMEERDRMALSKSEPLMTTRSGHERQDCISPDLIAAYFHDLVSVEEKQKVENHLDNCNACLNEFASLAKDEIQLASTHGRPLPNVLRARVNALWKKDDRGKEPILRIAVRLAKEGVEILRDSVFPPEVFMQPVFAPAGAYRSAAQSSLPSGVSLKRTLPGSRISILLQQEKEDRAGLQIKLENENSDPLEGQRVLLRRDGVLLYSERTDTNGAVTVMNLEPGVYQIGMVVSEKEFYVDVAIEKA